MNKNLSTLVAVVFLTGCATGQMQTNSKNNETAATNQPTDSSAFRNLYKPKTAITRDQYGHLESKVGGELVLDYSALANSVNVQESQYIQQYCRPSRLVQVTDSQDQPLVNASEFGNAITSGNEIARKRAIWQLYVNKTNEAQQAVPMRRYEQSKTAREQKAQKESDAGYVTKNGRVDSRKLSNDLLKKIGLGKKDPLEERQKAEEAAYEKFKQDLAYNQNLLAAQDRSISNLEQAYVARLSNVYQNALNNLTKIDPQNMPMQTLKQFGEFRGGNIYLCINERFDYRIPLPSDLQGDYRLFGSPYEKYLSSVIQQGSADAIKKLELSKSSAGIESEFNSLYPTVDLKKVALNTPVIADSYKTRRQELVVAEKIAYEKEQKRLAAEAIKQARLKMKNNSTPSAADVQRAVLLASMQRTNRELPNSRTEIRTNFSYDEFDSILGNEFQGGEANILVENVKCQKEGGKQKCSYDERSKLIPYALGAKLDLPALGLNLDLFPQEVNKRENMFLWTESGLIADADVEVRHFRRPPPSSGAGSAGREKSPLEELHDDFMWSKGGQLW